MKQLLQAENNKLLYRLFALILFLPMLNYYIAAIFYAFGHVNPYSTILYAILYSLSLFTYFYRLSARRIVSTCIAYGLLLASLLITDGVWAAISKPDILMSPFSNFYLIYFPLFLLTSDKNLNFDILLPYLYRYSFVIQILCITAYFCQVFLSGQGLQEYMTFAYTGLLATMIGLYYSWNRRHIVGIIISTTTSITVLFGGCRGALFTLLVFVALMIIFNIKKSSTRRAVVLVGFLLFFFFNDILGFVGSLFESFGYESRIFKLIEAGETFGSEGRQMIFDKAISLLSIFGHGIFSDRVLLEHVSDATYCHNIVLELLVDFGYIVGGGIILYLAKLIIHSIRTAIANKFESYRFMVYMVLSMFMVKLMLSNSYLNSGEFMLGLGWLLFHSTRKDYATEK